jgi:hypothetical protein
MTAKQWSCPFCEHSQISTTENRDTNQAALRLGLDREKLIGFVVSASRCLNPACGKISADIWIGPWLHTQYITRPDQERQPLFSRTILPEGAAKVFADYVPQAIRNDYYEACLIRDLSPKASATLARRCLQGMIRDFAGISVKGKRLVDEISALEMAVQAGSAPRGVSIDSIEAITALRKVGNIGAHKEADIDVIVEVDPGEAQAMIGLIESLIEDWYVERQKRAERFAKPVTVAVAKVAQLQAAKEAKALEISSKFHSSELGGTIVSDEDNPV